MAHEAAYSMNFLLQQSASAQWIVCCAPKMMGLYKHRRSCTDFLAPHLQVILCEQGVKLLKTPGQGNQQAKINSRK
jgi:hypothetical protein